MNCRNKYRDQLSPRQAECLRYLREAAAEGRPFPDRAEVAALMGWKNPHGFDHVMLALQSKGYVLCTKKHPSGHGFRRFYELTEKGRFGETDPVEDGAAA